MQEKVNYKNKQFPSPKEEYLIVKYLNFFICIISILRFEKDNIFIQSI